MSSATCGASYYDALNTPIYLSPGVTTPGKLNTLAADPIDLSTGIFMLSATDLVLPGRTPLALTRSYRSGDGNRGVFGPGTMMGYEEFLQLTSSTVLTYVYHGDARTAFVQQPDGTFTNATVPAFRGARITVNGDGTRTLREKDGRTVTFQASPDSPMLSAVTDANGNRITITRGTDGLYYTLGLTDATGRGWTLTRDPGFPYRVGTVTDSLGRTVSYEYDLYGQLAKVTNPAGGVTQYTYDSHSRMTAITDARGLTYLTNTYDPNSRVCRQTQADTGVYAMYYGPPITKDDQRHDHRLRVRRSKPRARAVGTKCHEPSHRARRG